MQTGRVHFNPKRVIGLSEVVLQLSQLQLVRSAIITVPP